MAAAASREPSFAAPVMQDRKNDPDPDQPPHFLQ
jgi:hypothetical protein